MLSNTGNPKKHLAKTEVPCIGHVGSHILWFLGSTQALYTQGHGVANRCRSPAPTPTPQRACGIASSHRSLPRDAGIVSRGEIITGMDSAVVSEKVGRKRVCIREA